MLYQPLGVSEVQFRHTISKQYVSASSGQRELEQATDLCKSVSIFFCETQNLGSETLNFWAFSTKSSFEFLKCMVTIFFMYVDIFMFIFYVGVYLLIQSY